MTDTTNSDSERQHLGAPSSFIRDALDQLDEEANIDWEWVFREPEEIDKQQDDDVWVHQYIRQGWYCPEVVETCDPSELPTNPEVCPLCEQSLRPDSDQGQDYSRTGGDDAE